MDLQAACVNCYSILKLQHQMEPRRFFCTTSRLSKALTPFPKPILQAMCNKAVGTARVGSKMHMGVSGHHIPLRISFQGSAPQALGLIDVWVWLGVLRQLGIMKFMSAERLSLRQQEAILHSPHLPVAKRRKPGQHMSLSRNNSRHRVRIPGTVRDGFRQIHITAAFGEYGKSLPDPQLQIRCQIGAGGWLGREFLREASSDI